MHLTLDYWRKHLIEFSKIINGAFHIEKRPVYGDNYELYYSEIIMNRIALFQSLETDNSSSKPSALSLLFTFKNQANDYLSINERDFFDKIFSGRRIKTDNQKFDKRFTINSSNKKIAKNLFGDEKVQSLFLNNRLLVFNISTSKGETTIKLKYMESRLYSIEEMTQAFNEFKNILDKILK